MSALARFRRHPGLSLRKTVRRLAKTVRRHLSLVLPPPVLAFAASAVLLGATAAQAKHRQPAPKPATLSADWLPVTASADRTHAYFVYRPSVVRSGRYSAFWALDSDMANNLSTKLREVIDCEGGQLGITAAYSYRGLVAGGPSLDTGVSSGPWQPIAPETVADGLMHAVCGGLARSRAQLHGRPPPDLAGRRPRGYPGPDT